MKIICADKKAKSKFKLVNSEFEFVAIDFNDADSKEENKKIEDVVVCSDFVFVNIDFVVVANDARNVYVAFAQVELDSVEVAPDFVLVLRADWIVLRDFLQELHDNVNEIIENMIESCALRYVKSDYLFYKSARVNSLCADEFENKKVLKFQWAFGCKALAHSKMLFAIVRKVRYAQFVKSATFFIWREKIKLARAEFLGVNAANSVGKVGVSFRRCDAANGNFKGFARADDDKQFLRTRDGGVEEIAF